MATTELAVRTEPAAIPPAGNPEQQQFFALVADLAKNPIIELVFGFVLVEWLQRHPVERPMIGDAQGNLIETAIAGIIAVQQLAPSMPYLAQAGGDLMKSIGPLLAILPK